MASLLIKNCHALVSGPGDGPDSLAVQPNRDILIEGGKISAIRPTGAPPKPDTGQVIDAHGMLAMPGLINTHAHVPMGIFRGLAEDVSLERWFNEFMWPLESNLTEEDVYWGMLLGLAEMIEGGVTTVADHYFYMDRAAEAVAKAGTRAALGWAVFGSNGYNALDASADFVERWQGQANGRITTWMAPHAPYTCDDDFLRATVRHAGRLGVGIHIHAAEEINQTRASQAKRGLTPIQVLAQTGVFEVPVIIAHGCGILPEDISLLAELGAQVG
ncbi:MAG: amidohydrolase family protein, partial [Anaerolineae bacterium]